MGLRQLAQYRAKYGNGQEVPLQLSVDPTSGAGGSYAGKVVVGAQLVNVTSGRLFICTAATATSATWQLVGSQV